MNDKRTKDEILKGMDEAAGQAKQDFMTLPEETRRLASEWVRKWYLKAGYKRLGRFLVGYAKDQEKKEKSET
ncbi:MAG: hypothetical protein JSW02_05045 [candidate division WOR-3 bacterium]|nr:MAG: hypothetical protein JSW02_05045 [candidate division WOR-3 bacterium]